MFEGGEALFVVVELLVGPAVAVGVLGVLNVGQRRAPWATDLRSPNRGRGVSPAHDGGHAAPCRYPSRRRTTWGIQVDARRGGSVRRAHIAYGEVDRGITPEPVHGPDDESANSRLQ